MSPTPDPADAVEAYYDSTDADHFYAEIWGGEDIHVGLYESGDTIPQASRRTVDAMAARLKTPLDGARVLDMGAGYGGAARHLVAKGAAHVTCLNVSEVENARNRARNAAEGLSDRIDVVHGRFEDAPVPSSHFDVVWSQDAFLHSGDREQTLREAARALKHGGELIFTDPMQADGLSDTRALQPIYDRLNLANLASAGFYRDVLARLGFEDVGSEILTRHMRTHYARVGEELARRRRELQDRISADYAARMIAGLDHWVSGADAGRLVWGILHFRKA